MHTLYVCGTHICRHTHICKTLTYTVKYMFASCVKDASLEEVTQQSSWSSKYFRKCFQGSQISGKSF